MGIVRVANLPLVFPFLTISSGLTRFEPRITHPWLMRVTALIGLLQFVALFSQLAWGHII